MHAKLDTYKILDMGIQNAAKVLAAVTSQLRRKNIYPHNLYSLLFNAAWQNQSDTTCFIDYFNLLFMFDPLDCVIVIESVLDVCRVR